MNINSRRTLCLKKVERRPQLEIPLELRAIEQDLLQEIEELEGMLR